MSEFAIRVQDLSKQYRLGHRQNYKTLRDVISNAMSLPFASAIKSGNRKSSESFWALQDVSFQVKCGEAIGIIGHNGAGKSTLLKILSGITEPTRGQAEVRGRLASLLEVGTGFHPELSGRENIYLNGAILGMKRKEIESKFDEIVSFAEVDQFIDTPVKHYSSGMFLRLAFAVAAHLEPEILLIDEVLAVGDAAFQKKCLGKMDEVASGGRTVLFVSHNMAAVQQLTRNSLLLDHGNLVAYGPSSQVISQYLDSTTKRNTNIYDVTNVPRRYPELKREIEFARVELEDYPTRLVPADAEINLRLTVHANESVERFRFSITIFQIEGTPVGNCFGPEIHSLEKGNVATFQMRLADLQLARGRYYCALAIGKGNHLQDRIEFDIILDVLHFEVMAPLRSDGVMSEWFPTWGPIRFKEPTVTRID